MTDPISNERLAEDALVAFGSWTKAHTAEWNLSAIVVNGKFDRFIDTDTDTAWLGFEAAWSRRQSPAGVEPVAYTTQRMLDAMKERDTIVGSIWPTQEKLANVPLYASPPKAVTITDEMVERSARALAELEDAPLNNLMVVHTHTVLTAAFSSEARS